MNSKINNLEANINLIDMKINEKKFIEKAFVGIDVHKSNWKVCLLGELNFKKEFSCDPYPKALETSLKNLLPDLNY